MMIYLILILAIVSRFVPHLNNFAPITALAIFSAVYLPKKQAIIIPLAVRFVSDIFLGFFSWPLMVAVYASHLVGVLFGLWIKKTSNTIPSLPVRQAGASDLSAIVRLRRTKKEESINTNGLCRQKKYYSVGNGTWRWLKIIFSSIGASAIFFLVTNFAFLYAEYSHNLQGIILAYTNGLPFLRGTLIGDLSYTIALFGAYELAKYLVSSRQAQKQTI